MAIVKRRKASGKIETDTLNLSPEQEAETLRKDAEIKARMSPPGALNLHPSLDKARIEHGLVDEVFDLQPAFDRVFVYQIDAKWAKGETFVEGGLIQRAPSTKDRQRRETPVGVLTGGGQYALDVLRSNGFELGDVVAFCRLGPWALPVAMLDYKEVPLMILRAGDLLGSYDLTDRLRSGKCHYELDPDTQQHIFVDETGRRWIPKGQPAGDEED